MDGDALEEDGFAIQQDLFAACLDGAETDFIGQCLTIEREVDTIKFGVLRRP